MADEVIRVDPGALSRPSVVIGHGITYGPLPSRPGAVGLHWEEGCLEPAEFVCRVEWPAPFRPIRFARAERHPEAAGTLVVCLTTATDDEIARAQPAAVDRQQVGPQ